MEDHDVGKRVRGAGSDFRDIGVVICGNDMGWFVSDVVLGALIVAVAVESLVSPHRLHSCHATTYPLASRTQYPKVPKLSDAPVLPRST